MPLVNYCKKCKTETPLGELCPYCQGKLAKTGERLSFGTVHTPWRDWFEWNRYLRVGLPVLALVLLAALVTEGISGGVNGIIRLLSQGFFATILWLLLALLVLIWLLLWLQGDEKVHYWLDREGVKAYVYLQQPSPVQLYARLVSLAQTEALAADEHSLPQLTLIRRVIVPWTELRRIRVWREGQTILFFRPSCWQVLAMRCPLIEFDQTEDFVRAKVKRLKNVKVQPVEKPVKKGNSR